MNAAYPRDSLTRSVEDYLKAIYRLTSSGNPAATSDIAGLLEISPPSVSGMVKRLSEQGLLAHVPYRGVELTDAGRRAALRMIRRHRLIESYLVAHLGYTWDTVHDEAERLEHAVSDDLVARMAAALGDPEFDPHGDPIPAADGSMAAHAFTPLDELPVGSDAVVRRVATSDPARLRYVAELGLQPGARVHVSAREPFGGPITLEVEGGAQVLGGELSALLLCERS
ncbi:MAG: metal-dependent transcriptional regulator [Gemmatimonadota bacterium]|nr:metal-dependent transcriptional regulator [Gemmatimonadota bacterium]